MSVNTKVYHKALQPKNNAGLNLRALRILFYLLAVSLPDRVHRNKRIDKSDKNRQPKHNRQILWT